MRIFFVVAENFAVARNRRRRSSLGASCVLGGWSAGHGRIEYKSVEHALLKIIEKAFCLKQAAFLKEKAACFIYGHGSMYIGAMMAYYVNFRVLTLYFVLCAVFVFSGNGGMRLQYEKENFFVARRVGL